MQTIVLNPVNYHVNKTSIATGGVTDGDVKSDFSKMIVVLSSEVERFHPGQCIHVRVCVNHYVLTCHTPKVTAADLSSPLHLRICFLTFLFKGNEGAL